MVSFDILYSQKTYCNNDIWSENLKEMKEIEDTWVKNIPGRIYLACLKNKKRPTVLTLREIREMCAEMRSRKRTRAQIMKSLVNSWKLLGVYSVKINTDIIPAVVLIKVNTFTRAHLVNE